MAAGGRGRSCHDGHRAGSGDSQLRLVAQHIAARRATRLEVAERREERVGRAPEDRAAWAHDARHRDGQLRRGARASAAPVDGTPRCRRRPGHARHGLHPQQQDRRVGRERDGVVRGGRCPPVERHPRHPVERAARAARRHRARDVPGVHHAHRGRDDRRRPARQVDVADEPRLPRSEDVPLHPDHGRGTSRRGVPQAGPRQRRWSAHVPRIQRGPAPHHPRGQDLPPGDGADAPAR